MMLKGLFIVVAMGVGLALITVRRWGSMGAARAGPDDLTTPLMRQLWRQGCVPTYGAAFHGTALAPVLAYELYPPDCRRLYDCSRALDVEILELLRGTADKAGLVPHAVALQSITRRVRRQLIMRALTSDSSGSSGQAEVVEKLDRQLDVVAATLARLSTGADA